MSKEQFSFDAGFSQLKMRDVQECRLKLMAALGIKTRAAFLSRKKGDIEPKISEAKAIEEIFAGYGIKNVWGVCK